MWNLLGGIAGAIGSIYGAQASEQNTAQTNQMNYMLGQQNLAEQDKINQENLAQQLNFAQNSAGWNLTSDVNAAKAAGINPLAALGVSGSSFSNLVAPQNNANMVPAKDLASAYSNAGQSLGRAISAIQSPEDRAFDTAQKALTLQKGALENDVLRSQLTRLNAPPGQPPGVPNFSDPGVKAGILPDAQVTQTTSGDFTVVPPHEISSLGFFHPASLAWSMRNGLLPVFSDDAKPQSLRDYSYNPLTMSYSPRPKDQSTFWYWADRNNWLGFQ